MSCPLKTATVGRFDDALVDSFIIQDGEEMPEEQKLFVEKVTENWNI